jgi:hypothetical protein
VGESFLIKRGGCEVDVSLETEGEGGSPFVVEGMVLEGVVLGFWRLGSGEFGREGGAWVLSVAAGGGGVEDRVMLRVPAERS